MFTSNRRSPVSRHTHTVKSLVDGHGSQKARMPCSNYPTTWASHPMSAEKDPQSVSKVWKAQRGKWKHGQTTEVSKAERHTRARCPRLRWSRQSVFGGDPFLVGFKRNQQENHRGNPHLGVVTPRPNPCLAPAKRCPCASTSERTCPRNPRLMPSKKQTSKQASKQTNKQTNKQANKQTNTQTHKHTNRQANKQTN